MTTLYSIEGVMEICRWSQKQKADDFMDFCWQTMKKLFRGEIVSFQNDKNTQMIPVDAISNQLMAQQEWMSAAGRKIEKIENTLKRTESGVGYLNYYHRRQSAAS